MGLLDDLRQQSETLQAREEGESASLANAEEYYRTKTQPTLHQLYLHLDELVKHLNYLTPDLSIPYHFNADGLTLELKQKDYKARIDSTTETKIVSINFECSHPKEIRFVAKDKNSFERNLAYLKQYNLSHQLQEHKNNVHEITGGYFSVKPSIPISFVFKANIEKSTIDLTYTNFDGLGSRDHSFKADQINDTFYDDFGRYIIRENKNFLTESISDEAKEAIRARIQAEQQERQKELKEVEALEAAEEEKRQQNKKGPLQLFKKLTNL